MLFVRYCDDLYVGMIINVIRNFIKNSGKVVCFVIKNYLKLKR